MTTTMTPPRSDLARRNPHVPNPFVAVVAAAAVVVVAEYGLQLRPRPFVLDRIGFDCPSPTVVSCGALSNVGSGTIP